MKIKNEVSAQPLISGCRSFLVDLAKRMSSVGISHLKSAYGGLHCERCRSRHTLRAYAYHLPPSPCVAKGLFNGVDEHE